MASNVYLFQNCYIDYHDQSALIVTQVTTYIVLMLHILIECVYQTPKYIYIKGYTTACLFFKFISM